MVEIGTNVSTFKPGKGIKQVGVLLEPTSVIEKWIIQAYESQHRLRTMEASAGSGSEAGLFGFEKGIPERKPLSAGQMAPGHFKLALTGRSKLAGGFPATDGSSIAHRSHNEYEDLLVFFFRNLRLLLLR